MDRLIVVSEDSHAVPPPEYVDTVYHHLLPDSRDDNERWTKHWRENCVASVSFVKRSEVAMRHEIGIENVFFGRDHPHAEGTWPNTGDWLNDGFAGVPEDELRLILGENAIRMLGLDRDHLASIAARIGPTVAQITGQRRPLDPRLIASWDSDGSLKPAEQVDPDELDPLVLRGPCPRSIIDAEGGARAVLMSSHDLHLKWRGRFQRGRSFDVSFVTRRTAERGRPQGV